MIKENLDRLIRKYENNRESMNFKEFGLLIYGLLHHYKNKE